MSINKYPEELPQGIQQAAPQELQRAIAQAFKDETLPPLVNQLRVTQGMRDLLEKLIELMERSEPWLGRQAIVAKLYRIQEGNRPQH